MKKEDKIRSVKNFFLYPWRVIVVVFGFTVLLIGIVMIFLPGPSILVIPLGLSILATEFIWARRLLNKVKDKAEKIKSIFSCKSNRS